MIAYTLGDHTVCTRCVTSQELASGEVDDIQPWTLDLLPGERDLGPCDRCGEIIECPITTWATDTIRDEALTLVGNMDRDQLITLLKDY